jgi:hypothetical protein
MGGKISLNGLPEGFALETVATITFTQRGGNTFEICMLTEPRPQMIRTTGGENTETG